MGWVDHLRARILSSIFTRVSSVLHTELLSLLPRVYRLSRGSLALSDRGAYAAL